MSTGRVLFDFLKQLDTEQRNTASMTIDTASAAEIVAIINREDQTVALRVAEHQQTIAALIDAVAAALAKGGRLIYVGAGTSGRLGVIDAAECPPTFGTDPETVLGIMAGGEAAMFRAQEGAEDSETLGAEEINRLNVTRKDVIVGLAASGRTPFVWGALDAAAARGAITAMVCCVHRTRLPERTMPTFVIDVVTGPEVVMGSTRMKAATAQKMICNMISTGAMIRLGKVFQNVMVDLKLTNQKLVQRAIRILMLLTGCSYDDATALLKAANGHVKSALVMHYTGCSLSEATERLAKAEGFITKALNPVS